MAREMSTEVTPATTPEAPGFKIGRRDVACIGPILGHNLWMLFSIPIGPSLLGPHPLLLSLLRGSVPAMITTGAVAHRGDFPVILALLAPLLINSFSDPFYYWAGMRYGRRIFDNLANQGSMRRRQIAWAERVFQRWGAPAIFLAYFIPFLPQPLLLLFAGETRMRIGLVALADGVGLLSFVFVLVLVGWYVGTPAIAVADTISHYGLYLTMALIVVVFVISFRSALRAQQDPPPAV
jgi:membrane protein DedA with SNARE-associated domain